MNNLRNITGRAGDKPKPGPFVFFIELWGDYTQSFRGSFIGDFASS